MSRQFTGPCLCGDPYCRACGGDPELAKLEVIIDEITDDLAKSINDGPHANFVRNMVKAMSPIFLQAVKEYNAEREIERGPDITGRRLLKRVETTAKRAGWPEGSKQWKAVIGFEADGEGDDLLVAVDVYTTNKEDITW